jgi:hypothetical protein
MVAEHDDKKTSLSCSARSAQQSVAKCENRHAHHSSIRPANLPAVNDSQSSQRVNQNRTTQKIQNQNQTATSG